MTLKEYLDGKQFSQRSFAKAIGIPEESISRWVSGARKPNSDNLGKLEAFTRGKVTARDFMEASE